MKLGYESSYFYDYDADNRASRLNLSNKENTLEEL